MDKGIKDVSVLTVSQCKTVKEGMLEVSPPQNSDLD